MRAANREERITIRLTKEDRETIEQAAALQSRRYWTHVNVGRFVRVAADPTPLEERELDRHRGAAQASIGSAALLLGLVHLGLVSSRWGLPLVQALRKHAHESDARADEIARRLEQAKGGR